MIIHSHQMHLLITASSSGLVMDKWQSRQLEIGWAYMLTEANNLQGVLLQQIVLAPFCTVHVQGHPSQFYVSM